MKITHSFIVLTSIVFITGSMLTVSRDLKATTDNVSTNVIEAKHKYIEEIYSDNTAKGKTNDSDEQSGFNNTDQAKNLYKIKLESLNHNTTGTSNKHFSRKRTENRVTVD